VKGVIAVDDLLALGCSSGANLMAPSMVSVPLLQKKTRERSPPVLLVSFSATEPLRRLAIHAHEVGHVAGP